MIIVCQIVVLRYFQKITPEFLKFRVNYPKLLDLTNDKGYGQIWLRIREMVRSHELTLFHTKWVNHVIE